MGWCGMLQRRGFYVQILNNDAYQDLVPLTHIAVVSSLSSLPASTGHDSHFTNQAV